MYMVAFITIVRVKELRWAVKHLVDIARVLREKRNRQGTRTFILL